MVHFLLIQGDLDKQLLKINYYSMTTGDLTFRNSSTKNDEMQYHVCYFCFALLMAEGTEGPQKDLPNGTRKKERAADRGP